SSGTLRYEAPLANSLSFKAQFPTDKLTLLVPTGTTVASPQLKGDGTSTDKNVTYDVWTSAALKVGDTVTVSLVAPATASETPWATIALVTVAVLGIAAVAVVVLRRRRRTTEPAPTSPAPKAAKAA